MAKKQEIPVPEYEKFKSITKIDEKILECQRTIARKYKLRVQAESARRDLVASYNEQIKHLKEELDYELGVLSGWDNRKKVVSAQGATEDEEEEPAQEPAPVPTPMPVVVPATIPSAPAPQPVAASVPLPPPMGAPLPPPSPGGSVVPFPRKNQAA